jgi:hypothetical protein
MGKPIPLIGSPYDTRDPIKAARRCVNLYPEKNGQSDSQTNPFPYRYWPIPGLRKVAQAPNAAPIRCEYTASNGDLYVVSGNAVYFVAADLSWNALGTIHEAITPVSMADNGLCIILVDGTSTGYVIDMASRQFGGISDDAFYGADRVDYVDTYFTFNRPGTNQWYISLSEATFAMLTANLGFDPLDVAAKTGGPDQLVTQIVKHREVWLIGSLTSEPWFDAGAADFAFAAIPGAFIDHGCVARYSVARQDVSVFWLSRDREGQGIVVRTDGYEPKRISTHGIEADIQTYPELMTRLASASSKAATPFISSHFQLQTRPGLSICRLITPPRRGRNGPGWTITASYIVIAPTATPLPTGLISSAIGKTALCMRSTRPCLPIAASRCSEYGLSRTSRMVAILSHITDLWLICRWDQIAQTALWAAPWLVCVIAMIGVLLGAMPWSQP